MRTSALLLAAELRCSGGWPSSIMALPAGEPPSVISLYIRSAVYAHKVSPRLWEIREEGCGKARPTGYSNDSDNPNAPQNSESTHPPVCRYGVSKRWHLGGSAPRAHRPFLFGFFTRFTLAMLGLWKRKRQFVRQIKPGPPIIPIVSTP